MHALCPYAQRVRLALTEKGLVASEIEIECQLPTNQGSTAMPIRTTRMNNSMIGRIACCVLAGVGLIVSQAALAEDIKHLNSGLVLPTHLPFSEAVRVGNTIYLSGQIGNKPGTLELVPGGIGAETRQVMENIKTTLEAHKLTLDNVVKCTVMLESMSDWPAFNAVYATFFKQGRYPARSAFGASGLALGAKVEVECVAAD
jgi:2-iminobutanoate/2-iminopropanoate deaminase